MYPFAVKSRMTSIYSIRYSSISREKPPHGNHIRILTVVSYGLDLKRTKGGLNLDPTLEIYRKSTVYPRGFSSFSLSIYRSIDLSEHRTNWFHWHYFLR